MKRSLHPQYQHQPTHRNGEFYVVLRVGRHTMAKGLPSKEIPTVTISKQNAIHTESIHLFQCLREKRKISQIPPLTSAMTLPTFLFRIAFLNSIQMMQYSNKWRPRKCEDCNDNEDRTSST